jgi:MFS family permease
MLVAAAVMGIAWGPMNPLLNTVVQRRVEADEQGRVYGVQMALFYAAPPVAMLIVGGAVTGFGLAPVFLTLAVLLAVVCVAILLVPAIRRMDA